MALGSDSDAPIDTREIEDHEKEAAKNSKRNQMTLDSLGVNTADFKAKRVSASNASGLSSKRQKRDEAPDEALARRAFREEVQTAHERYRGPSGTNLESPGEDGEANGGDKGVAGGISVGIAGGDGAEKAHTQGGTRGRGRPRGSRNRGAARGRGGGRAATAAEARRSRTAVDVDKEGEDGGGGASENPGAGLTGPADSNPEPSDDEDVEDREGIEEVYDVEEHEEEEEDDDDDTAEEEEEEEEEGKAMAGKGRGRSRGRGGRGAASDSGRARRGRGGAGRGRGSSRGQRSKGASSQEQPSAGGDVAAEGPAEPTPAAKKSRRRQGQQQQAKRRGAEGTTTTVAATAGVDDSEMPSEAELQELWRSLVSEPEWVISAEGILRVANQLGLPDYENLVGPMLEFAREKVPGLPPDTTGLSYDQFRRLLEALYNPQLPGEQPLKQQQQPLPSEQERQVQQPAAIAAQQGGAPPVSPAAPASVGTEEGRRGLEGLAASGGAEMGGAAGSQQAPKSQEL